MPEMYNLKFIKGRDISQAFDKVWHEGLLYKLSTFLPNNMYSILQSYLTNRYFRAKYREAYSSLRQILAGVPQGSVLCPLLYLIYTADLPTLANSTTATFADDTAFLTVHEDPTMAAHRLQMLTKLNSVALVRTRTIPTERPPPVGEVSANFCG